MHFETNGTRQGIRHKTVIRCTDLLLIDEFIRRLNVKRIFKMYIFLQFVHADRVETREKTVLLNKTLFKQRGPRGIFIVAMTNFNNDARRSRAGIKRPKKKSKKTECRFIRQPTDLVLTIPLDSMTRIKYDFQQCSIHDNDNVKNKNRHR